MKTRILIVSHKDVPVLRNDMHLPVMAGAVGMSEVPQGWLRDDGGDNISDRNKNYCELTALYRAWKDPLFAGEGVQNIGLCHYRRYFGSPLTGRAGGIAKGRRSILTSAQAEALLGRYDVILPNRRRYFIETNYSQYAHAHHEEDLVLTRQIIAEKYPGDLEAYDRRMKMTWGHRFNMFITRRELLDEYCSWLFDILFELEKRLDISEYSEQDKRVFGFVSERLLDVWLDSRGYRYVEVPCIYTEVENFPLKAARFAARKIRGSVREMRQKKPADE